MRQFTAAPRRVWFYIGVVVGMLISTAVWTLIVLGYA